MAGNRRRSAISTSRSAAPVGEVIDADAARQLRYRALARGVEQAFGREPAFQLLEPAAQHAFAGFLDVVDDELILAARLVEARARAHEDLLAVRELEAEAARGQAEHRAAHLRLGVLQRPIEMPGGGAGKVRDLALDPDRAEAGFDEAPRLAIQTRDRENPPLLERQLERIAGLHAAQYKAATRDLPAAGPAQ